MKEYSAFPRVNINEGVLRIPQRSSLTIRLFSIIFRTHVCSGGGGSYPSAEMQSVCSTFPANWAVVNS